MPPRWLCVLIAAAWLTLSGWLFYDDLLPGLLPGQPPPVTIDVVEEAQTKIRRLPVTWSVFRDGRKVCDAHARLTHPDRGEYVLSTELLLGVNGKPPLSLDAGTLEVLALANTYRVNPEGDLLGFECKLRAVPRVLAEALEGRLSKTGSFDLTTAGEVASGRLQMTRTWAFDEKSLSGGTFFEARVPRGASVVLALNPPRRVRGVAPGQTWQALGVDPFAWATEPVRVAARVRPEPETFSWGKRPDVSCLVIDYKGERFEAAVWVGEEDGVVVAQEATLGRTKWALFRN